jgi:hypothetical protein
MSAGTTLSAGGAISTPAAISAGTTLSAGSTISTPSTIQGGFVKSTGNIVATGAIFPQDGDGQFFLAGGGTNLPSLNYASGMAIKVDRNAQKYLFIVGNATVASIDASGNLRVSGNVIAATQP